MKDEMRDRFKKGAAYAFGAAVIGLAIDAVVLGVTTVRVAASGVRLATRMVYDVAVEWRGGVPR